MLLDEENEFGYFYNPFGEIVNLLAVHIYDYQDIS